MVKRNQHPQLVGDRMQTVASDVARMFYGTTTVSLLLREASRCLQTPDQVVCGENTNRLF